jgi:hypothetical protein
VQPVVAVRRRLDERRELRLVAHGAV